MSKPAPLAPGATIGVIGGGQLGRMIAVAAAQYGLKAHIYCPDPDSPAFEVAGRRTVAAYDDAAALQAFAESVDVVTYEFENIPSATAELLAARRPLHPSASALATTQDRLTEKSFVAGLGIPVAPFRAVDDAAGLTRAVREIGLPAVLKTRRFGYDGKGQIMLREPGFDPAAVMASLGDQPCILEGFVAFEAEVSVVAARTAEGGFSAYEPCANEHRHHILARTVVPAPGMAAETAAEAMATARTIAEALGYVGVLAVEMFLVRGADGRAGVVVNEIAPRVHNSGHWTIEGAQTSQFAQHVRAICGWPLGSPALTGPSVEMLNLIGDQADGWARILAEPGSHLHLYGKGEARPGRKMGHLTRVATGA